ncbi:hypothetical protein [Acidaminococcus massiliensis]|jgi:hypothetical protein|uniref:hypothetical protein n=1 Tax=Acidaminococcus massiliensis TaxID=1852375 RepID=UPI0023F0E86B|nr:hypothetical protein [Acidaminococcus massiliensis]
MKTKDALAIGIKLGRLQQTLDAWEESKHPRANNGQFSFLMLAPISAALSITVSAAQWDIWLQY